MLLTLLRTVSTDETENHALDIEQAVDYLKHFVSPLRTFLETKHNVGNVGAVREAIAAYEVSKAAATSPKPKKRDRLRNVIRSCLDISHFDGNPRPFAPEGAIDNLIKPEEVKIELEIKRNSTNEEQQLIDYIVTETPRIFSITMYVGVTSGDLYNAMKLFKQGGITDTRSLPIIHKQTSKDSHEEESTLTKIDPTEEVWEYGRRQDFYERQWTYLAQVFSTSKDNYDLHPMVILPFKSRDAEIKEGAFGHVFKVEIHEKHLVDPEKTVSFPIYTLSLKHSIRSTCANETKHSLMAR